MPGYPGNKYLLPGKFLKRHISDNSVLLGKLKSLYVLTKTSTKHKNRPFFAIEPGNKSFIVREKWAERAISLLILLSHVNTRRVLLSQYNYMHQ